MFFPLSLFIFGHAALIITLSVFTIIAYLAQLILQSRTRAWTEATMNQLQSPPPPITSVDSKPLQRSASLPLHFDKSVPITKDDLLLQWREMLHEQGPVGWTWAGIDQTLQHLPWYLWAVYRLIMIRLPQMAMFALWSKFTHQTWVPDQVSDDIIYDMVISTPLIIVTKHDSTTNTLILRVPDNLPAEFFNGSSPRGLHLVLCCDTHTIISAEQPIGHRIQPTIAQSKKGITANQIIFAHLLGCNYCWLHPRTHVLAEKSAREILSKGVIELEPSSRFVAALHDGLVFGSMSPIRCPEESPMSCLGSIKALFACIGTGPLPHDLSQSKRKISPYFDFLLYAHEQVRYWVKFYEFNISSEALFSNMVAHAVDHTELHRVLGRVHWLSIDTSGTFRSYICSQMFREVWVPHIANLFDNEHLNAYSVLPTAHPFYRNLYWGLKSKSQRFADQVTLSSSW